MFRIAPWCRHALLGLLLGIVGAVGLWGFTFFSADLKQMVLRKGFSEQGYEGDQLNSLLKIWSSWASLVTNFEAFFGMFAFSWATGYLGRRWTFAIAFLMAMLSTTMVFMKMSKPSDIFWMVPLMGFFQLAIFGGYAIYFPELFPTRLRSTGISFCYNVGRFVAAIGPFGLGLLTKLVFTQEHGFGQDGFRLGGVDHVFGLPAGADCTAVSTGDKGEPVARLAQQRPHGQTRSDEGYLDHKPNDNQ